MNFESTLFKAADKLRKNMDAAEYKHIVLGLIFLKYISDSFEELHRKLEKGEGDFTHANPEDPDEYLAHNVFFIPQEARWKNLLVQAKQPGVGEALDTAMEALERLNPTLKGILPKVYAKPNLDKAALGQLLDMIATIGIKEEQGNVKDILGRVYEYFLGEFANAEGKKGGQFYTPKSIVTLMVEMLQPYKGRVYDPCCGSGGMFVMSERFVEEHQGRRDDISIYGQESNQTTWKLCRMNLAIRGVDGSNVAWNTEGSFLKDAFPDLKADFILANPPFNDSDWSGEILREDPRWQYGTPPLSNANYAWMQHFLYHLSPEGRACFVLSNSSLSAERTGEVSIRKKLINEGLVECITVLPKNLFYNTSIPACLWFLSKHRKESKLNQKILFIDARNFGRMVDKKHRIFDEAEIEEIAKIYHSWRNGSEYSDLPNLCKSVSINEILEKNFNLSPNLYLDVDYSNLKSNKNAIDTFISQLTSKEEEKALLENQIKKKLSEFGFSKLSQVSFANLTQEKLISLQKLIFDKLFVYFDIPNHKSDVTFYETNSIDIPKLPTGWSLKKMSDCCAIVDCLHSKKPQKTSPSKRILLEVYNIADNGLLDEKENHYISEDDYIRWSKNIEVVEGDCVITNTGRVGAIAQIPANKRFAIGRNMTAVRSKMNQVTPTYLLHYLLSSYMKTQIYRKTDIGTILDSLNVKGIKQILIVVPPFELLEEYEGFARPMRRLIEIISEGQVNSLEI
jgi:type I restriction enzyme M protein